MVDEVIVDTMGTFAIQDNLGRNTDHDTNVPNKPTPEIDTVGDDS